MNVEQIRALKGKRKITMLTAYDYQIAHILEAAGVDIILVGDSLGMVFQGNPNTKTVTQEAMLYHTKAVAKGVKNTLVVSDLPIHTYDTPQKAVINAKGVLKVGAKAVKIEGSHPDVVSALLEKGIPVMGHVGLLPQTANEYRVKGKKPDEADQIWRDALQLDKLGVFCMVLEALPEWLARKITFDVKTPTIGIGAGKYCDGQVLVINDILGLDDRQIPKFVKRYVDLRTIIGDAVRKYIEEVQAGKYPDKEHTYH
jgi:3-methyl-2-oxobutanoate hydroxymethyltransferase